MSGLTLMLPHGYEGQGPEHSSGRLERYLQSCAQNNIRVCNLTSAANYFHALRRQIRRNFRKPLVVFTPKSLLRAREVASRLDEMGPESSFHRIIAETGRSAPPDKVRRVVLCSGKVYFDLAKARESGGRRGRGADPRRAALPVPAQYARPGARTATATPRSSGARRSRRTWGPGILSTAASRQVLAGLDIAAKRPIYAGRAEAASPATGLFRRHVEEQAQLVAAALAA